MVDVLELFFLFLFFWEVRGELHGRILYVFLNVFVMCFSASRKISPAITPVSIRVHKSQTGNSRYRLSTLDRRNDSIILPIIKITNNYPRYTLTI